MTGRPLIGVTTYLEAARIGPWHVRYGLVTETYLLGIEEAGGTALMLPPQPFDDAVVDRVLDALDGLVLSGGADVDPARYGEARDPRTQDPQPVRDAWELALVARAVERRLPVLAICRGVQVLNTALGGTLLQHVPDVTDVDHGEVPGRFVPTSVDVIERTRLAEVLSPVGERLSVRCSHHQALDRVAPGLVVAAHGSDGLVEAVEVPEAPFIVGVQWHPEQDAADRRLFAALVRTAAARRRPAAV